MIQDIQPYEINIDFKDKKIQEKDIVIYIQEGNVLLRNKMKHINVIDQYYIRLNELEEILGLSTNETDYIYLFEISGQQCYLYVGEDKISFERLQDDYNVQPVRDLYSNYDNVIGLIAYTANHINDWFKTNQFCGRCGHSMIHSKKQRVMTCSHCQMVRYPQISPVVIVAITHDDKILLTKYANSAYDRYALVAGFVEIGENFEGAVRREVFEEVGLRVKNIEYFDSQPWGITGGLMAGYFAELEGDPQVKLDLNELKEGTWMTAEEMPKVYDDEKSLTRTLMYQWYKNQIT